MIHKISILAMALLVSANLYAQRIPEKNIPKSQLTEKMQSSNKLPMTPEKLWDLGRVSADGLSADGSQLIYTVSNYDLTLNKSSKSKFLIPVGGGEAKALSADFANATVLSVSSTDAILYLLDGQLWTRNLKGGDAKQLTQFEGGLENVKLSPDGKQLLFSKSVLIHTNHSADKYADLPKSNVYIYDDLDYRHWDTFNDGRFNHPFVATYTEGIIGEPIDILKDEPFYSPQAPFGGAEDYTWSPDSKAILYVCKKSFGKAYAQSTNTDIYRYELATAETTNLTKGMLGYDTNPTYSPDGNRLTWLSMKTEGYEADKNDIILFDKGSAQRFNLTADWDGTVNSFAWSKDNRKIYFTAAVRGTIQLFEIAVPNKMNQRALPPIQQISEGNFDITGIVAEHKGGLIVSSTKLTRATEIFLYRFKQKDLQPITQVNDAAYAQMADTKVESRVTKASDGQDLFSWVIYPPNFDPTKKYPTLLFCQGGPQAATTQFYSFRWNFQLIASQGYIVIAPNRRGMPGWGVKWNADISKDWGGQSIRDYLSAIDDFATESYVDKSRIGAVGASYGGYSVFQLAGLHENRFSTFISHCGLFDMTSWYGTTEELFFANHELGGPYWDAANTKAYTEFNPINFVSKWKQPILIIQGGKDFRVPIGQGLAAFQAAQLQQVKSRLVYLPDENHWVLSGHNAQVWQREFFGWLKETL